MTDRRGGAPRSETARIAILTATARQFLDRGFGALTIEGIASEAGVGKQTIYRWWGSKTELVAESMVEGILLPEHFTPNADGTLREDLGAWLRAVFAFVDDEQTARMLGSLVAASTGDAVIAERMRASLGADAILARRFEQAIADGDLPASVLVPVLTDLLLGAVVMRIIAHGSRGGADAAGDVDRLLDVLVPASRSGEGSDERGEPAPPGAPSPLA